MVLVLALGCGGTIGRLLEKTTLTHAAVSGEWGMRCRIDLYGIKGAALPRRYASGPRRG